MAILLLGLVAIAGGVAATVYVRGEAAPMKDMVQETTPSAPVSAQVATSTAPEAPGVPEGQKLQVRATISPEVQAICAEAKQVALPLPKQGIRDLDSQKAELVDGKAVARNSLIGHMHILCDELLAGEVDEEELKETEQNVHEKWTLWLKTQGRTQ